MAGNAVAKQEEAQVPDLVRSSQIEIDATDIQIPRIKIGQYSTWQVKKKLVEGGDIFSATSKEDPEPQVLWGNESSDPGVLFHVLSMKRRKSLSVDGELESWDYNDPDAPPEAWVTYNYVVTCPEVDPDIPFNLLLTKTGQPAAKRVNTVIARNQQTVPAHSLAFRMTTDARSNPKGDYWVPIVAQVDATDDGKAVAATLFEQINSGAIDTAPVGEEPAI